MQDKLIPVLTGVGAAALLFVAVTLGPTTITSAAPRVSTAATARSWVATAFPTGQAGFARNVDGGR